MLAGPAPSDRWVCAGGGAEEGDGFWCHELLALASLDLHMGTVAVFFCAHPRPAVSDLPVPRAAPSWPPLSTFNLSKLSWVLLSFVPFLSREFPGE